MLEEYDKAWNIFQEAAKRNYDNWQIWDNVLTVSAKCGHFDSVSTYSILSRLPFAEKFKY